MNEMWPAPLIAQKPHFVYTSRWDRLLARVWPAKRRKLAMMQRLADMNAIELLSESNRIKATIPSQGVAP